MSTGVSRLNSSRSLTSSRSGSPSRPQTGGHTPQSPAVRSRLGSPVKHSPTVSSQTRNAGLVRRHSSQVEAPPSPTITRQRNIQSTRPPASIQAPPPPPPPSQPALLVTTPPLQPSLLRQVASPPPEPSATSSEPAEEPSIQPSPIVSQTHSFISVLNHLYTYIG